MRPVAKPQSYEEWLAHCENERGKAPESIEILPTTADLVDLNFDAFSAITARSVSPSLSSSSSSSSSYSSSSSPSPAATPLHDSAGASEEAASSNTRAADYSMELADRFESMRLRCQYQAKPDQQRPPKKSLSSSASSFASSTSARPSIPLLPPQHGFVNEMVARFEPSPETFEKTNLLASSSCMKPKRSRVHSVNGYRGVNPFDEED